MRVTNSSNPISFFDMSLRAYFAKQSPDHYALTTKCERLFFKDSTA